jgi:hypothetical protein
MTHPVLDTHALRLPGIPFHYRESRRASTLQYLRCLDVGVHSEFHQSPSLGILRDAIRTAVGRLHLFDEDYHSSNVIKISTCAVYKLINTTIPKPLADLAILCLAGSRSLPGQSSSRPRLAIKLDPQRNFAIDCDADVLEAALRHLLNYRFDPELDRAAAELLPAHDSGRRLRYILPMVGEVDKACWALQPTKLAAVIQEGLGLNSHLITCQHAPRPRHPAIYLQEQSDYAQSCLADGIPPYFTHAFPGRTTKLRRELGSVQPWRNRNPRIRRSQGSLGSYYSGVYQLAHKLEKYARSRFKPF